MKWEQKRAFCWNIFTRLSSPLSLKKNLDLCMYVLFK